MFRKPDPKGKPDTSRSDHSLCMSAVTVTAITNHLWPSNNLSMTTHSVNPMLLVHWSDHSNRIIESHSDTHQMVWEWDQVHFIILLCWAEQMRQQQRALKRTNRDLERDRHSLERQEKQLVSSLHACDSHVIHVTSVLVLRFSSCHVISLQEAEIKKAAKRGDKQVRQLAGIASLSNSKLR